MLVCEKQSDGIYRLSIIYRNKCFDFFISTQHLNTLYVDVDGFGVCFEMGEKCYRMRALNIRSL